jgi:hypothetical protein
MNTRTATAAAARILGLRLNDAARNSRQLLEISAVYFWDPSRSRGSVIVGTDGAHLYAGPSIPWDQHLGAYMSGRRSNGTD